MFLRPIRVQVAHVERDVPVQVFGLGTVEARVTSKVGFKVSGVLVDLRADVGDRVAKGAVLARLDDREQSARVRRAKAAIEQAEANLLKATASLEKAQANYDNAKSINERRQKLVQSNITSVETAETAKAVQDAARAEVNVASSDIAVARAAISDAKAQQQQESATLDFHTLAAPYDAMVTARLKELGSALGAGEPVFTLIDPQSVWVLAYIDESKSGEIRVGAPADIVLRSLPDQRFRAGRAHRAGERPRQRRAPGRRLRSISIPEDFHLGEQAEVYITTVQPAAGAAGPGGRDHRARQKSRNSVDGRGRAPCSSATSRSDTGCWTGATRSPAACRTAPSWSRNCAAGCASAARPRSPKGKKP